MKTIAQIIVELNRLFGEISFEDLVLASGKSGSEVLEELTRNADFSKESKTGYLGSIKFPKQYENNRYTNHGKGFTLLGDENTRHQHIETIRKAIKHAIVNTEWHDPLHTTVIYGVTDQQMRECGYYREPEALIVDKWN